VVALKQPPKSQNHDKSVEKVVEECRTLAAIRDLAEFFGIPFDRLSVFDAFPYITEQELKQQNVDHAESHAAFHRMIVEKRPDVVLTAWKAFDFRNYETKGLQKLLTGEVFPSPQIEYVSGLTFSTINTAHPGYFVNHYRTESCFRQLQILEFAQACGRLRGIWEEEPWMTSLRERCGVRAKELIGSKFGSYISNTVY
jgi:hypothetical protein